MKPEKSFLIMDDSFATSGRDGAKRVPFINSRPLTCWAEDDLGVEICIAPVLVCSQVSASLELFRQFVYFVSASRLSRLLGEVIISQLLDWWFRSDLIMCDHSSKDYK